MAGRIFLANVGANASHRFSSPIFSDGTFEFTAQNVGVGVRINWGGGTLTLKDGSTHEFSVEGLQLVGIGYTKITAPARSAT